MNTSEPTVYVVDDDMALRESLEWLLESEGLRAQTFDSAESFMEAYDAEDPGCLVLDIRMRGMSGIDLQQRIVREELPLPVIMITGHGTIPMAVRAMQSGVVDFLEKPVPDQVLVQRIREALRLDGQMRADHKAHREAKVRLKTLSPREREVMELVVQGRANKQVAAELGIADKTVEVHRKRVMQKMGVRSAVDLVHIVNRAKHAPQRQATT